MSQYPEHDKLDAIKGQSQACGEFMEWLTAQGFVLAKYHFHTDECRTDGQRGYTCQMSDEMPYPAYRSVNDLLAERFGIDQNVLEAEKRAILSELRARSKA